MTNMASTAMDESPCQLARQPVDQQDDAQSAHGGGQPGQRVREAKGREQRGFHPLEQRRILQGGRAVAVQDQPVSRAQDILGNVGVLRVVVAGEIARAERCEDQNRGKNCENREVPAGVQQPKYIARMVLTSASWSARQCRQFSLSSSAALGSAPKRLSSAAKDGQFVSLTAFAPAYGAA